MRKDRQAKDIPERPILEFISSRGVVMLYGETSVLSSMPEWANEKLALAKMRSLIKRGLVDGCACGCRGNFELAEAGIAALNQTCHSS